MANISVRDILDSASFEELIPQRWNGGLRTHIVRYIDSNGTKHMFRTTALNQADAEHKAFLWCGESIHAIV